MNLISKAMEDLGVSHVFGSSGGPTVTLVAEFGGSRLRTVLAKHKQGTAMMADGYVRVSRGIGVCFATSGPGATNALTAVASTQASSVPLLLLTEPGFAEGLR